MIRPEPRSIMCGSTAWDMKNAPERLTAITLYQSSSVIFSTVLSIVIPALLTRMSSRPWRSITSSIVRRQSSAEPTLPWWMLASTPCSRELGEERARRARRHGRSPAATIAPCSAKLLRDRAADPAGAAGHEHDASVHPGPAVSPGRRALGVIRGVEDGGAGSVRMSVLAPREIGSSALRALAQPVGELGPDLLAGG